MGTETKLEKCGDKMCASCECGDPDGCMYVAYGSGKALLMSVSLHETNLRRLRCPVTGNTAVTLHHTHGGSVKEAGWNVGKGQRQNPFLQMPLAASHHVGQYGIDYGYGVKQWEKDFGTQVSHLIKVNSSLVYDIWEQAILWEGINRGNTAILRHALVPSSSTVSAKQKDTKS